MAVEIDEVNWKYKVSDKVWVSWTYAFQKAETLWKWLAEHGVHVERPSESDIGRLKGYDDYVRITAEAKLFYDGCGMQCFAFKNPQLIPYEGQWVEVVRDNGKTARFVVGVWGKAFVYHIEKSSLDSSKGRRAEALYKSVRPIGFQDDATVP